VYWFGKLSSL